MARKSDWVFTKGRKASIVRARREHSYLVRLGKKARARGMKL